MNKLLLFLLPVFLAFLGNHGFAQTSNQDGFTIKGTVTDSNHIGIPDVELSLKSLPAAMVLSNEKGIYELKIPKGENQILIQRRGFVSQEITVNSMGNENRTTYVNIILHPEKIELQTVNITDNPSLVTNSRNGIAANLERIPGGTDLVGLEQLKMQPSHTLKDALGNVPGVLIQDFFGGNDQPRLNVRGSGIQSNPQARGISLLQDGLPINLADGSYIIGVLEPQAAHLAEIYKGSNGLEFGSSTLGGAINLITKNGYNASPLALKLEGGSYRYINGAASTGWVFGKNDAYVSASFNRSDGFREHNHSKRFNISANLGHRFNEQLESRLYINYTDLSFQVPGPLTMTQLLENPKQINGTPSPQNIGPNVIRDDPRRDSKVFRIGNKYAYRINEQSQFEAGWYFQHMKDVFVFPIANGIRDNQSDDGGVVLSFKNQTKKNVFTIGSHLTFGGITSKIFINKGGEKAGLFADNRLSANNEMVYANNVYAISSKLDLVATVQASWDARKVGERMDNPTQRPVFNFATGQTTYVPSTAVNGNKNYFGINPKIGLIYKPTTGVRTFANFSRSYEPPTFLELMNFRGGTPNSGPTEISVAPLKAQYGSTLEIGTAGEAWNDRFHWNLSLYNSWIKGELLTLTEVVGITGNTINSPSSTIHQGMELGVNVDLLRNLFSHRNDKLNLRAAYTLSNFYFTEGLYKDNKIAGIPTHYIVAALQYDHPTGFFLNFNIESLPKRTPIDHVNELYQEPYTLLNARVGFQKGRWGIFVDGKNLADKKYASSYLVRDQSPVPPLPGATINSLTNYIPGIGRNFVAGLNFTF